VLQRDHRKPEVGRLSHNLQPDQWLNLKKERKRKQELLVSSFNVSLCREIIIDYSRHYVTTTTTKTFSPKQVGVGYRWNQQEAKNRDTTKMKRRGGGGGRAIKKLNGKGEKAIKKLKHKKNLKIVE
jgi:hypothetical protein